MEGYDYIIVGSGSAGSVLAARLMENPDLRVLVIEAGSRDTGFWLKLPVGYFRSIYDPRYSHLYRSEPDPGIAGRQMDCPRGRVLGGSGAINGLIFIRGQSQDFDDWRDLGARGWGYNDVLPHFRCIESYDGPPSQYRGAHGPIRIRGLRNENPACDAWLEAAAAYGLPPNTDFNSENAAGIGRYQLTLDGHWRSSAGRSMLKPALARPNLTLKLCAQVTGLTKRGAQVTGVSYLQDGTHHQAHADQEVILCAGAVQSPQILQLAGIGPADLLRAQGIDVVHDAPEVGENLQDHLQLRTIVTLANGKASLNTQVRNPLGLARMGLDWLLAQRGPLTVGAGQVGGAMCTKYANGDRPDLQLFVMPLSVDKPGTPLHRNPGFTTSFWLCHPESRGSVQIQNADPLADPKINLNYLSQKRDRDVMVEGLRIVRDIYNQPGFKDRWTHEVIPGAEHQSYDDILSAARRMSSTVYHLVGTCRMGSDSAAVVDPDLRVNGIDGLRVVDASVMPKITSANTNLRLKMVLRRTGCLTVGLLPTGGESDGLSRRAVASKQATPSARLSQSRRHRTQAGSG